MKCPYCSGEVEAGVAKCKHCGEWLDLSRSPTAKQSRPIDNSSKKLFTVKLKVPGHRAEYQRFTGESEALLRKFIKEEYPDSNIDEKFGVRIEEPSRYACPKCGYKYTECQRDIGCAVLIVIFISFGLGLIMIPFLPYHCQCKACGYSWKT